jgi:hypothetical protein
MGEARVQELMETRSFHCPRAPATEQWRMMSELRRHPKVCDEASLGGWATTPQAASPALAFLRRKPSKLICTPSDTVKCSW